MMAEVFEKPGNHEDPKRSCAACLEFILAKFNVSKMSLPEGIRNKIAGFEVPAAEETDDKGKKLKTDKQSAKENGKKGDKHKPQKHKSGTDKDEPAKKKQKNRNVGWPYVKYGSYGSNNSGNSKK